MAACLPGPGWLPVLLCKSEKIGASEATPVDSFPPSNRIRGRKHSQPGCLAPAPAPAPHKQAHPTAVKPGSVDSALLLDYYSDCYPTQHNLTCPDPPTHLASAMSKVKACDSARHSHAAPPKPSAHHVMVVAGRARLPLLVPYTQFLVQAKRNVKKEFRRMRSCLPSQACSVLSAGHCASKRVSQSVVSHNTGSLSFATLLISCYVELCVSWSCCFSPFRLLLV